MARTCALSIVGLFAIVQPCRGEVIIVDIRGSGDHSTIQPAIDAASEGDTVLVKAGEYVITEPILFSRTRRIASLVVRSQAGPEATTIRMSSTPADPLRASVVIFESGEPETIVLEGFTITGGTEVAIPPLGSLHLASHYGPAHLQVTLQALDQERTQAIVTDPNALERASDGAVDDVSRGVRRLIWQVAGASVLGAMLLGMLIYRSARRVAGCGE